MSANAIHEFCQKVLADEKAADGMPYGDDVIRLEAKADAVYAIERHINDADALSEALAKLDDAEVDAYFGYSEAQSAVYKEARAEFIADVRNLI